MNVITCFSGYPDKKMESLIYFGVILAGSLFVLKETKSSEFVKTMQDEPMLLRIKRDLSRVHPVVKSLTFYSSNESYTIDKSYVHLCLRDPNTGKYYAYNNLIYVALHEVSHVLDKQKDNNTHTGKFVPIFDSLLRTAAKLGIYDPTQPMVENYCKFKGSSNGDDGRTSSCQGDSCKRESYSFRNSNCSRSRCESLLRGTY